MAVNLQKGQKISLDKEAGGALSRVTMGLGWDVVKKKRLLRLRRRQGASRSTWTPPACCSTKPTAPVDVVWFRQLKSRDGSIVHTGDNRTGAGDGDDEQIIVDLRARAGPGEVAGVHREQLHRPEFFDRWKTPSAASSTPATSKEIARYDLSVQGSHTAQIMAKLYRHNGEWKMHAIGENGSGRTFDELMPQITPHLN